MKKLLAVALVLFAATAFAGDSDFKIGEPKANEVYRYGHGTPCVISTVTNGGMLAIVSTEGDVWILSRFRGKTQSGSKAALIKGQSAAQAPSGLLEQCSCTLESITNEAVRQEAVIFLASLEKK